MKRRINGFGVFAAVIVGVAGVSALLGAGRAGDPPRDGKAAEAPEAGETTIAFAQAPEAVRAAALRVIPGGEKTITKVVKELDDAIVIYEVEFTEAGAECSAVFSEAGAVLEVEKSIGEAALPAAALAGLKAKYAGATFTDLVMVQKTFYEVEVVVNGKSHEVKVNGAGDIDDDDDDEGDDDDEDHDDDEDD